MTVVEELYSLSDEEKIPILSRFFKTKKGQYGYGDKFLGIKVPETRIIAKKYYREISLEEVNKLLKNEYHEIRLAALIMLTYKIKKSSLIDQGKIVKLYLKNTKYINNWDLVDLSAGEIMGYYLFENNMDRTILYDLANSNNLWEQRISIVSTQYFIKNNEYQDTINISEILLNNSHDLIQKAVGWMLREVGKRNYEILYNFLLEHSREMPRTMLRYAIEKFEPKVRKEFLEG